VAISYRRGLARDFRALCESGSLAALGDAELLERFAGARGDRAELAFAALVARHGPMVLRACRAILRDGHDADDAFQATFLLLARRARTLWVRDSLAPWLHSVACRVAAGTRAARVRRQALERRAAGRLQPPTPGPTRDDLGAALHEEIERLPERLKGAVVLCYLQGLTHDEAAAHLGCPIGTVRSRLARGRDRLRTRLGRLGLAPPTPAKSAAPAVPLALATTTARAALHSIAAPASAGWVAHGLVSLTQGASIAMLHPLKTAAVLLFTTGAVAVGVSGGSGQDPKGTPTAPSAVQSPATVDPTQPQPLELTPTAPSSPIDRYKRITEELRRIVAELQEKEPLAARLRQEYQALMRDPTSRDREGRIELMVARRLEADPEIRNLFKLVKDAKARVDDLRAKARWGNDPAVVKAADKYNRLQADYAETWDARKLPIREVLAASGLADDPEREVRDVELAIIPLKLERDLLKAELLKLHLAIKEQAAGAGEVPVFQEGPSLVERNAHSEKELDEFKPDNEPTTPAINVPAVPQAPSMPTQPAAQNPPAVPPREEILNLMEERMRVALEYSDRRDLVRWLRAIEERTADRPAEVRYQEWIDATVLRRLRTDFEIQDLFKALENAKTRVATSLGFGARDADQGLVDAQDRLSRLKGEYAALYKRKDAEFRKEINTRSGGNVDLGAEIRVAEAEANHLKSKMQTLETEINNLRLAINKQFQRPFEASLPQGNPPAQGERNAQLEQRLRDLEGKLDVLTGGAKPGPLPAGVDPDTVVKVRTRFNDALVEKVFVHGGSTVKKGDPLIEIKCGELAQAKIDCQTKYVHWDHDRKYLVAREPLAKEGRVTQVVWTDTQNDEKKSRLDYLVSRNKLASYGMTNEQIDKLLEGLSDDIEKARQVGKDAEDASRMTILSPIDGVVFARDVVPGDFYDKKDVLLILVPPKPLGP